MGEKQRLQKFLARAGVASRRGSEELIAEGRVAVDGVTVDTPGATVDPETSVVTVDGRRVERRPARWVALHKPPGYLCTREDPEGRPTVYDLLPVRFHDLFHVGRLDFLSEGLILLANEGDVAHRLLHPSSGTSRRYEVGLVAPAPERLAERLLEGVELEDGPAAADTAALLPGTGGEGPRLLMTLHEGRNREIRRMLDALGARIRYLRRLSFGPVELGPLEEGSWRELSSSELSALRAVGREDGG